MQRSGGTFVLGTLAGFLLSMPLLLLLEPPGPEWVARWGEVWSVADRNLQGSIPLFLLVLLAYLAQVSGLHGALQARTAELEVVVRREQMLDLCASLFFGIGVIWTAIGMRGALLFALGSPGEAVASGAMAVLERLVEGGILLALSTTIVGGVGGYLMRAAKHLLFGQQLARLYMYASQAPVAQQLAALERIERHLAATGERAPCNRDAA